MSFEFSVQAKAIDLVRLAIDMTAAADSGHPSSGASLAHLVTVLMYQQMRYDPADPTNPAADQLVLSEGHACPIVYAAAADIGIMVGKDRAHWHPMTREDALTLRDVTSPIDGHPNPAEGFPFFPAATGSLGQGLSIASGLALSARLDGLSKRVFCLIGDGESREGQIWEALDFIVDYKLTSVCPIFNCNAYGQADKVSTQQSPQILTAKLQAYGFDVRNIDGHNGTEIRAALEDYAKTSGAPVGRPLAIVARTAKGWGFATPERGGALHGKAVTGNDRIQALAELDKTAVRVGAQWTPGDLRRPEKPPVPPSTPCSGHASGPGRGAQASRTGGRADQGQAGPAAGLRPRAARAGS